MAKARRNFMIAGALSTALASPFAYSALADSGNAQQQAPETETVQLMEAVDATAPSAEFQQVSLTPTAQKVYDVTFEYGPGVNVELVNSAARVATAEGCDADTSPTGYPNRVKAKMKDGNYKIFEDPGHAAGWAIENCPTG